MDFNLAYLVAYASMLLRTEARFRFLHNKSLSSGTFSFAESGPCHAEAELLRTEGGEGEILPIRAQ